MWVSVGMWVYAQVPAQGGAKPSRRAAFDSLAARSQRGKGTLRNDLPGNLRSEFDGGSPGRLRPTFLRNRLVERVAEQLTHPHTHTPTYPHTPKGALFSPVLCLHVVKLAPFHSGLFPIFPFGLRPKNRGSFSTARPFCGDKIQLKSLRDNISSTTTVAHPELRKH